MHTTRGLDDHSRPKSIGRIPLPPFDRRLRGTGDNNSALVGMRVRPSDVVVSLGTSDGPRRVGSPALRDALPIHDPLGCYFAPRRF